jgi:hypothetical protein
MEDETMKSGWQYVQTNGSAEKMAPMTLVDNVKMSEDGASLKDVMPSNPNLLINGDFQVWQRGNTWNGPPSYCYFADRWLAITTGNMTISKQASGVNIAIANGNTHGIVQVVEDQGNKLSGKTVTVTVYSAYPSAIGPVTISQYGGPASYMTLVEMLSDRRTYIGSVPTGTAGAVSFGVYFDISVTSYPTVKAIKMELGNISTPFIPRIYAEELAMCQRYYLQDLRAPLYYQSGAYWACPVQFPVQMRIAPNIATTKYGIIGSYETTLTGHSIGKNNDGIVYLGNVSGLTTTQQYYVYFNGLDAEIY